MEKLRAAMNKSRAMRTGTPNPVQMQPAALRDMAGTRSWETLTSVPVDQAHLFGSAGDASAAPFDLLRTRLWTMMQAQGWKRLAITSPAPKAGKSTVAACLSASLMRQAENRIILMDMDMRRPGLGSILDINGHDRPNTGEVLAGEVSFGDAAIRISDNLAVTVNSRTRANSAELLQSTLTADVLKQIEADYAPSVMIFDLPPMLACDDAAAFMRMADCALLVVEADVSTVSQVDQCEKELSSLTNVAGVILNKGRFENSDRYGDY